MFSSRVIIMAMTVARFILTLTSREPHNRAQPTKRQLPKRYIFPLLFKALRVLLPELDIVGLQGWTLVSVNNRQWLTPFINVWVCQNDTGTTLMMLSVYHGTTDHKKTQRCQNWSKQRSVLPYISSELFQTYITSVFSDLWSILDRTSVF